MRLGLIADIHADPDGLVQALTLLQYVGVDQIVCAGDLVDKGPNGDLVIDLFRAERIPCVAGNHDHNAARVQAWYQTVQGAFGVPPHLRLEPDNVEFLSALPAAMFIPAAGHTVMVAHGTPWNHSEYLYPASRPHTFQRVAQEVKDANSTVLVLGHTHTPMATLIDGVYIVNPGSVCGTYANGTRTLGILTLPSCQFEVLDMDTGEVTPHAKPLFELLD